MSAIMTNEEALCTARERCVGHGHGHTDRGGVVVLHRKELRTCKVADLAKDHHFVQNIRSSLEQLQT